MFPAGFEWDPRKRESNVARHGVDFRIAIRIFEYRVLLLRDDRKDYGEDRFAAIGWVEGIAIQLVFTPRGDSRRIISARRASRRERARITREFSL